MYHGWGDEFIHPLFPTQYSFTDSILASSVADIDASASFLLDSRRALHHTADAYSTSKRALLQSGTAVKARVVNGWDAQPDQYPYTAYLRMQTNCLASGGAITNAPQQPLSSRSSSAVTGRLTMLCGASLIMPRVLLTAGHCMYKCSSSQAADSLPHEIPTTENDFITWGGPIDIFLNQYNISIPTSEVPGAEARNASGAVRNPKFLSVGNIPREYDAALIWFDEPSEVTPIQLNLNPKFDVGQQFMVAGWGYTKPDTFSVSQTLKTAQVPYVPLPLCSAKFNETVWKGDICAGANPANYMDTCAGDSGGPLMMNVSTPANGYPQILAGITSYGESCANSYPGVYTNAALQADWIDQSITLKNIGGLEIPRIGCASHTGQRYTGTGVTTFFKISNAAQCCNVCKVNSTSCRAWAWHKATKRCQVMTAVTGRSLSSSWTSGNVTG